MKFLFRGKLNKLKLIFQVGLSFEGISWASCFLILHDFEVCGFVYGALEKRSCRYILQMGSKTSSTMLLLLMIFWFQCTTVQCQEKMNSNSKPTEFKNGVKKIILSIALGVVTGLIGAILFACFVRCFVGYMNQTPIIKGPVIFSPKIDHQWVSPQAPINN